MDDGLSQSSSSEAVPPQESSQSFGMRSIIKTIKLKFSSVKNITTSVLAQWLTSQERTVVLLDSRPEEEFVVSHLEGAIRVDYETNDMTSLVELCQVKLQDKPQPTIVCYCSLGYRSSALAERIHKYHKTKGTETSSPSVYNLEGSLFQWANERRRMVDANGRQTPFAHPYSPVWGKLLDKELRRET